MHSTEETSVIEAIAAIASAGGLGGPDHFRGIVTQTNVRAVSAAVSVNIDAA